MWDQVGFFSGDAGLWGIPHPYGGVRLTGIAWAQIRPLCSMAEGRGISVRPELALPAHLWGCKGRAGTLLDLFAKLAC